MSDLEIKKLIDYFISNQYDLFDYIPLILSLIALSVSVILFIKQKDGDVRAHLSSVWNDVINSCLENPSFLDMTKTENYYMLSNDDNEYLKYEAYCYKVWKHAEEIIEQNKHKNEKYKAIIRWIVSYHYTWLKRNPAFFNDDVFWNIVEEIRKTPDMIFRYRKIPNINGDIDWSIVSQDYHRFILGPFAPEMIKEERNKIIQYLNQCDPESLKEMDILDFGCGPGNLIPYIDGKVKSYTGLDKDSQSVEIAKTISEQSDEVKFIGITTDILKLEKEKKYDLIISSNSILPSSKEEVVVILKKLREHLKPHGKIVAILPSYDTTLHLQELWKEYYKNEFNASDEQIERISKAFKEVKCMDDENRTYADDGHASQCYHTEKSIIAEMKESGLKIEKGPDKVTYPWKLTRKFDYGYFPDEDNEIYDWFVVAGR